jgi:Cys-rich repeat protein
MLRKFVPALSVAVLATALGGCEIYFGEDDDDDDYTYCDDTGCYWCDDYGCYPDGGGGPGWQCDTNDDCAAGCYCDPYGYCQEAGFCTTDNDCPAGFECDDRSSCVPGDSCPDGMLGDPATGCYWPGCDSDDDCAAGCFCNEETGLCEESGFCTTDADCPEGQECDDRSTCVPDDGVADCTTNADCGEGELCDAELGECRAPVCTEITNGNFGAAAEDMCLANTACDAIYSGSDCYNPNNNNAPCEDGDSGCICNTFDFAACIDAPPPPSNTM